MFGILEQVSVADLRELLGFNTKYCNDYSYSKVTSLVKLVKFGILLPVLFILALNN